MAATLHELFTGRTETMGAKPKAEIASVVLGAADEAEVRAIAQAQIPSAYLGIPRSSITLDERLNATTWKVRAAFEPTESGSSEAPQPVFSFDRRGRIFIADAQIERQVSRDLVVILQEGEIHVLSLIHNRI